MTSTKAWINRFHFITLFWIKLTSQGKKLIGKIKKKKLFFCASKALPLQQSQQFTPSTHNHILVKSLIVLPIVLGVCTILAKCLPEKKFRVHILWKNLQVNFFNVRGMKIGKSTRLCLFWLHYYSNQNGNLYLFHFSCFKNWNTSQNSRHWASLHQCFSDTLENFPAAVARMFTYFTSKLSTNQNEETTWLRHITLRRTFQQLFAGMFIYFDNKLSTAQQYPH